MDVRDSVGRSSEWGRERQGIGLTESGEVVAGLE